MVDVVFFSSVTGNTARFVEKLNIDTSKKHQIALRGENEIRINQPYIIITPTYGDGDGKGMVPHQVKKFLKENHDWLIGVISSGNINFGREFGLAGDLISYKFKVPLLHKFEIAGTPEDIQKVQTILQELETTIGEEK